MFSVMFITQSPSVTVKNWSTRPVWKFQKWSLFRSFTVILLFSLVIPLSLSLVFTICMVCIFVLQEHSAVHVHLFYAYVPFVVYVLFLFHMPSVFTLTCISITCSGFHMFISKACIHKHGVFHPNYFCFRGACAMRTSRFFFVFLLWLWLQSICRKGLGADQRKETWLSWRTSVQTFHHDWWFYGTDKFLTFIICLLNLNDDREVRVIK